MNAPMVIGSNITFAIEKLADCWNEALPLFERHKDELASYAELELDVDEEAYRQAEAVGCFVAFTVRAGRELVGYAAIWAHRCPHYIKEIWAHSDTIIIMPEYRNLGLGDLLREYVEENMRTRGARVMQWSVRADHVQGRALGVVLTHAGYKRNSITYSKRFD